MKKLLSITLTTLLVLFASQAFGQTSADVEVTADVRTALTLTPTAVAFGEIEQNTASTIAANENDGGGENTNVGANFQVGALQIQGDNTSVIVRITQMAELNTDGGSEGIVFTPSIYNGATDLELVADGNEEEVNVGAGDITLNIGGSLPAISTTGDYRTQFGQDLTLEVQYGSL